jgi:hypothetical protein
LQAPKKTNIEKAMYAKDFILLFISFLFLN